MPAGPPLYLDPTLPVCVRLNASIVQAVAGTQPATVLMIRPERSQLIWIAPAEERRLEHRVPWLLTIGQRLLDQVIVAAYGESRFSRFVESLSSSGVAPIGPGEPELEGWIDALRNEIEERPAAYRVRARSLLTDILLATYRATMISDPDDPRAAIAFSDLIDFIDLHYHETLHLDGLAKMMQTSPTHLSRVFRRQVGIPLFEYINQVRIRQACLLLRRTGATITEVAIEVGYNNISHFNRSFRKLMHCSPRDYRREAGS